MRGLNFPAFFNCLKHGSKKNAPIILTTIGIIGFVGMTIEVARETPKALKLIEEEKKKQGLKKDEKLDIKSTVKVTWRCYIPTAVTCGLSIGCIVSANSIYIKRNAALLATLGMTESAFDIYKDKVKNTLGEEKAKEIQDMAAQEIVEKHYGGAKEVVVTKETDVLCCDLCTGRYFISNKHAIEMAIEKLNHQMMQEMYVSLNDFWSEIGVKETDIGDEIGWNIDRGYIDVEFSSLIAEDGRPCLAISYSLSPRYDYTKLL